MGNLEKERKWRLQRRTTAAIAVLVLAACLATTADAIRMQVGEIVVVGDGKVIPSKLPRHENAPIHLKMHGRLSTVSGELPPILKHLMLEVDEDGEIETRGLPVCPAGKLQSRTVLEVRKGCPKAIIGTGTGEAVVAFPDQKGIDVSSPLTVFNGPSSANRWTVYLHAFITVPVPAAIVFKIDIARIDNGPLGYRVETDFPKIAGGAGVPIAAELEIGHSWTYRGKRYSYLNGRCEDGKHQAKGEFIFKDGTIVTGAFLQPCSVRP
jgi:hypothetical protein